MSQETLALKSGISKVHISRLESGRERNPTLSVLDALAGALQCDVADLVSKRPRAILVEDVNAEDSVRLLGECAGKVRTEHVALLIELAQALRELSED